MEVTDKTRADVKGGTLIQYEGLTQNSSNKGNRTMRIFWRIFRRCSARLILLTMGSQRDREYSWVKCRLQVAMCLKSYLHLRFINPSIILFPARFLRTDNQSIEEGKLTQRDGWMKRTLLFLSSQPLPFSFDTALVCQNRYGCVTFFLVTIAVGALEVDILVLIIFLCGDWRLQVGMLHHTLFLSYD